MHVVLTGVRVSVVVVDLPLGGVLKPRRVRLTDALAVQRSLVQLQADEREYRQYENG